MLRGCSHVFNRLVYDLVGLLVLIMNGSKWITKLSVG